MQQGIMLNIDDTHFLNSRFIKKIEIGLAELKAFVAQYGGTQVTDIIFCVGGRIMCYPSTVSTSYVDKYLQMKENGCLVDYTQTLAAVAYDLYMRKNLDPYAVWLEECRAQNIHGWLSLRMNDCHDNELRTSVLHPNFYHEHPEYRRVTHRSVDGYFDRCFDYAQEAVRARELRIIEEVLERYDVDGIELDWQREAFCFRAGGEYEGIDILNGFMREVSQRVYTAAKKRGHDIALSVRVPADPTDALEMGFDVTTWAREDWVQWVIPTPRWRTCDCDMPIGMWKRLLAGTSTQLAPGIELLFQSGRCKRRYASVEQVTALAHQHFALGGDRTYLFNYFDDPIPEDSYWARSDAAHEDMAVRWEHQQKLLCILGNSDLTAVQERRHALTERDLRPAWRHTEHILPFTCRRVGRYTQVRVPVGSISEDASVELTLGISEGVPEDLEIYANCRPVRFIGTTEVKGDFLECGAYAFQLPEGEQWGAYILLELTTTNAAVTVEYIDIHVLAHL